MKVPFDEGLHWFGFLSPNETSKGIFLEDSATILVDGQHLRCWQLERVARHPYRVSRRSHEGQTRSSRPGNTGIMVSDLLDKFLISLFVERWLLTWL